MPYVPSLLGGLLSPPHKAWQGQGSVALVAAPVTLALVTAQRISLLGTRMGGRGDLCSREPV